MQSQVSPVGIAALLEQASRLIHSSGYAEGLYPAQWIALRYFSEALPSSRTTASLARFQGMSLGPVARTVRTLVDKGLLVRMSNPASRRADLIAVTPAGQNLLRRDPRSTLIGSLETLSESQRETLASGLEAMLYTLFARSAAAGGANRLFDSPQLEDIPNHRAVADEDADDAAPDGDADLQAAADEAAPEAVAASEVVAPEAVVASEAAAPSSEEETGSD